MVGAGVGRGRPGAAGARARPALPRAQERSLRTFYFNRHQPDGTDNEALAAGGWLGYRSGWLLDTFAIGATLYGSAPLYAPDDRDGTLLLKPGQEGYYVPGEAWGALRYKDYARLRRVLRGGYLWSIKP